MSRREKMKKNLKMYSQTLYEVQRIVQVRWKQHRQECLIKWKGYDDCYNTWEPKEHITHYYRQAPLQQKDDDPEYVENIALPPSTPHNYQTRARKDKSHQKQLSSTGSKEDYSQGEQFLTPENAIQQTPWKRVTNESSSEDIEVGKKGQDGAVWRGNKETLVKRIVSLGWDESKSKRIGVVETEHKKIITMEQDVLKSRYPNKIIEYYESQMRNRAGRYY